MKIRELHIVEFGCLKDCRLSFSDGLNLLEGDNESGKSTVMLFIKFMLYGLPRRKAGDDGEHDRSISWQGHLASGSMVIDTARGSFRLVRQYMEIGNRRRGAECKVLRCEDGTEIEIVGEPGEYFLGVPREVFESTVAIGQMRSSKIDGEKTASALGNLLLTADESVDMTKVYKRLEEVRVEYLHKNRQGGRLVHEATELAELRAQLERETQNALRIAALSESLASHEKKRETVRQELERARALREQYHDAVLLLRFETLHQNTQIAEQKQMALQALDQAQLHTAFLPTEGHLGALDAARSAYLDAEQALISAVADEENTRAKQVDDALVRVGQELCEAGGKETVLASLRQKKKQVKHKKRMGIWCLTVGTLLAAGSAALAWLISVGVALPMMAAAMIGWTLCGVLFSQAKRAKAEWQKALAVYGKTMAELPSYLDSCEQALAEKRRLLGEREHAQVKRGFAQSVADRAKDALHTLLIQTDPKYREPIAVAAQAERERLACYLHQRETLHREWERVNHLLESDAAALAEYDEEVLKQKVTVDIHSVTPKVLEDAGRKCRFEEEKLKSLDDKILDQEKQRVMLTASASDPWVLRDTIAERTAAYEADREYYEALELAITALHEAEESMQGNVAPEIATRAGAWMHEASEGRYETVKTTKDMRLTMELEGYPIAPELVSGGTKELAYLSLRLALTEQIYQTERPPLLLDEALCQMDRTRATRVLRMLGRYCDFGEQILLFTCHTREAELCRKEAIPANLLRMTRI